MTGDRAAGRVRIQWTQTAAKELARIPARYRESIKRKVGSLADTDDPRALGKPLTGPLEGYRSLKLSRYRVLYHVSEESLPDGEVILRIRVLVVLVGVRKEGDKRDVYNLAKKLVALGLLGEDKGGR